MDTNNNNDNNNDNNDFVMTDDIICEVGILTMYSPPDFEHGPYAATLAIGSDRIEKMEIHTNGYSRFEILIRANGEGFEQCEFYSSCKEHVGWEGDFSNGWLTFSDPVEFHRVATALWGAWGCTQR